MVWTRSLRTCLLFCQLCFSPLGTALQAQAETTRKPLAGPPRIQSLVKESLFEEVLKKREVATIAHFLDKPGPPYVLGPGQKFYEFYSLMVVRADFDIARRILIDAEVYQKVVPFVSHASFDKKSGILDISGGVLGYYLKSKVKFIERAPGWVSFHIVAGHFLGLAGDFYFEDLGEKGTLVYVGGHHISKDFPPSFVMTRGGEIALSISGRKMRKYVEEQSRASIIGSSGVSAEEKRTQAIQQESQGKKDDSEIPQPRNFISR